MDRWRRWGLTEQEWNDCVQAARELELLPDVPNMRAEEIAAQLAVAKAAEEPMDLSAGEVRRLPIDL